MEENKKANWKDGWGSFFLAILIALTIRWGLLEAYVIPSGSMLPTLLIHDHIFVNKIVYGLRVPFSKQWLVSFGQPERGDVIVFRFPEDEGTFFIKRVIGVPGDRIEYSDGVLTVNDKVVEQSPGNGDAYDQVPERDMMPGKGAYDYLIENLTGVKHAVLLRKDGRHSDYGPTTVPEGRLFVMGDNRDNSHDSRFWGWVPMENVLGRASFVWLSCEDTMSLLSFLCNPLTVRVNRFFHFIN